MQPICTESETGISSSVYKTQKRDSKASIASLCTAVSQGTPLTFLINEQAASEAPISAKPTSGIGDLRVALLSVTDIRMVDHVRGRSNGSGSYP